jgi:hypothetical protein
MFLSIVGHDTIVTKGTRQWWLAPYTNGLKISDGFEPIEKINWRLGTGRMYIGTCSDHD